MKPVVTFLRSKIGRYVMLGVTAAAIAATLTFLNWRHEQHDAQAHSVALSGIASQMRDDASAWTRREKDVSDLMSDVRNRNVAAIGVSRNAILVSTGNGEKYYVADH